MEQSNTNTYIEFSFQKSLRKYQKPNKKIKLNNNHSCTHHNQNKLYRKQIIQSHDRLMNLQKSRKQQLIRSRNKARQYSSNKKRQIQNSNNKNNQKSNSFNRNQSNSSTNINNVIQRVNYHNPLSEFKIDEQLNIQSNNNKRQTLNQTNQKDNGKQFIGLSIDNKYVKDENYMQNELSIDKMLIENRCCGCDMQKQNNKQKRELRQFELINGDMDSKIIQEQEQDQSFSQIQINQINSYQLNNSKQVNERQISNDKQIDERQMNQQEQKLLIDYNKQKVIEQNMQQQKVNGVDQYIRVSYAYFSSCSSLEQQQKSQQEQLQDGQQDNIKQVNKQVKNKQQQIINEQQNNVDICGNNINTNNNSKSSANNNYLQHLSIIKQNNNHLQVIRCESRQQLKREYRQQYRDRIYYKIKKLNRIQRSYQQCECISQQLIKQLGYVNNNNQFDEDDNSLKNVYNVQKNLGDNNNNVTQNNNFDKKKEIQLLQGNKIIQKQKQLSQQQSQLNNNSKNKQQYSKQKNIISKQTLSNQIQNQQPIQLINQSQSNKQQQSNKEIQPQHNYIDRCQILQSAQQNIQSPQQNIQNQQQPQSISTNPSFKRNRQLFQYQSIHNHQSSKSIHNQSSKQTNNQSSKLTNNQSTKRKIMKLNFQIEQNYQCLGRIKISGFTHSNQSICLSIRRFTTQSKHNHLNHNNNHNLSHINNKNHNININKSKMVDYLISQRPYLQKSRQQLINLLQNIIDSKQNNIVKKLFQ